MQPRLRARDTHAVPRQNPGVSLDVDRNSMKNQKVPIGSATVLEPFLGGSTLRFLDPVVVRSVLSVTKTGVAPFLEGSETRA